MNFFQKRIHEADSYQRKHRPLAFAYAVVKKYSEDQAGYQAALVTYYGFLSLFPLLLILTTVAGIVGSRDPELGRNLVNSVSDYFPVIGQSLQQSVQTNGRGGLALIIALLFSLYGARGVADAFRNAINSIWHIPIAKRAAFPRNILRSLGLIFGGGLGLILASAVSGWAAQGGKNPLFALLSIALNVAILYVVFLFIFRLSLPFNIARSRFRLGAIVSAVGLAVLQLAGATILARITPNGYSALFATTIGLLAWIYLQAQVIMYAAEIATVKDMKLVPRGIEADNPTKADKKATRRLER